MGEAQLCRVQGEARSTALVLTRRAAQRAIVHLLAAYGMPQLRQMNANLVRAAGLQPARQERVARQLLDDFDMRDGLLADPGERGAAAAAIAAIARQVR